MQNNIIDKDLIEKMAKDAKFHEITIEKVLYAKEFLKEFTTSQIGNDFALIGGSSIAFFHERPYRLSTDLDFDFIGNNNLGKDGSAEIDEIKIKHSEILSNIAKSLGFSFKEIKGKNSDSRMLRLQLGYKSKYGINASVDLDIGYRYCHSVLSLEHKEWVNFSDLEENGGLKVQNLNKLEVWANQIVSTIGGERMDFNGKQGLGSKRKLRCQWALQNTPAVGTSKCTT